jgi:hypothetical protein
MSAAVSAATRFTSHAATAAASVAAGYFTSFHAAIAATSSAFRATAITPRVIQGVIHHLPHFFQMFGFELGGHSCYIFTPRESIAAIIID